MHYPLIKIHSKNLMRIKFDNPVSNELEKLPKQTLIELVKMNAANWMTLD